jgi:hypothetical protein
VQDFPGQKREQVGHVVRHYADRVEKPAETFVAFEKLGRGYRAAVSAAGVVDQVLGYEGFKAGEVIEQEDIAMLYRIAFGIGLLVQLDIELQ